MKKTILYGLTVAVLCSTPLFAQKEGVTAAEVDATKKQIEEYVNTRRAIAKDRNEWRSYQEITERRIATYKQEKEQLETQIAEAAKNTSSAEQRIAAERREIEELRSATEIVERALPAFEERILVMYQYFPKPLKQKLELLVGQVGRTKARASDRMAAVVGIMNEVDKFNSEFMHVKDERVLSNGQTIVVDVIYVGLAMAYFVDEQGEIGGFGVPGSPEWQWTDTPELAPQIRAAIDYYLGENKPANLVVLPAQATDISVSE